MKVRKLAVALALAGGLGSGVAQALGLGEIELQSYLNEPLDADITLNSSSGVSPNEVFVNLASEDAYRRVGLSRDYFLTKLRFNVTTASDGSLVVTVSSTEPVKEPYLNFLLEVTWPNGRLMREYAILVDPPVYAEDSGVQEQVQAPAAAPTQPAAPQQRVERRQSVTQPSAPRTAPSRTPSTFGPTGPSDTLWGIASSVRPNDSVTQQQVMLAIQDLNPDAFIGNNINRLKRGQVLRVPTLDQIQSRTRTEATREVTAQNEAFTTASRPVDARDQAPQAAAAAPAQAAGDELKLLVADDASERAAEEGGSAGGQGQLPGGVDTGSAVAMEELEASRRENEELSGRVEDLQDQVETLQRLLELKNSQLAELEQGLGEGAEAAAPAQPDAGAAAEVAADEAEAGESVADDQAEAGEEAVASEGEAELAVADELDAGQADESAEMGQPDGVQVEGDQAEADQAEAMQAEGVEESAESEMAGDTVAADGEAEQEVAMPEQSAAPIEAEQPAVQQQAQPEPEAEKAFPGNIIDMIMRNPMYQIALGGGLVLLLLLLLLVARRNASKEKEFYDQLNESEDDGDAIALTGDEEGEAAVPGEEGVDPIAEADTYIAYGRLDQAAHTLENAISREPSRTDLRLKLLGVYADSEDRNSFEKQFGELEALEDESAIAEAQSLRSRLEEAEAMPSIDDLESQLMSDSFGADKSEAQASEAFEEPVSEPEAEKPEELDLGTLDEFAEPEEEVAKDPDAPIEYDLSGISLDKEEAPSFEETEVEETLEDDFSSLESEELGFDLETETSAEASSEDEFDMDLGDFEESLDLGESEELAGEGESLEDEFESLDLSEESLETLSEETADSALETDLAEDELPSFDELDDEGLGEAEPAGQATEEDELSLGDDGALDESFLDELDAELDKVAGTDDEAESALGDESLDDLELDVSDEDLALMGEVAESAEEVVEDSADLSLDEELGLDDALLDEGAEEVPAEELSGEELPELEQEPEIASEDLAALDEEIPLAEDSVALGEEPEAVDESGSAQTPSGTPSGVAEIDESELGEDDDFDFLAGTDEAATKLDLARAYIEMGDSDGARDILEEVSIEGNDQQKAEAQDLLKTLS